MAAMGTKSREVIWGGTIMAAKSKARHAREEAQKVAREADRAEACHMTPSAVTCRKIFYSVRSENVSDIAPPAGTLKARRPWMKAVFLVTTGAGITGLWPAILADTGAAVPVTLNALRLLAPPLKHRQSGREVADS